MTGSRVVLASLSAAMDGGFTAVADVSAAMATSGRTDQHRLMGGVAVMLHVERLGLDLPLRATGDAYFGVPPHVLREPDLVDAIEALGYRKVAGNRWERRIDDRRVAAVDLLIPVEPPSGRHEARWRSLAEAGMTKSISKSPTCHLTVTVLGHVIGEPLLLRRPSALRRAPLRASHGNHVGAARPSPPPHLQRLPLRSGMSGRKRTVIPPS